MQLWFPCPKYSGSKIAHFSNSARIRNLRFANLILDNQNYVLAVLDKSAIVESKLGSLEILAALNSINCSTIKTKLVNLNCQYLTI